ncbi:hypothetical protein BDD12DRAFT_899034 [Trichophaea hybrida]|nr:hypothetical protein BDD12DRAFT_899034 [Trichophaea hybrida]
MSDIVAISEILQQGNRRGPEITPHCHAVIVALYPDIPQLGVYALPFRKIAETLRIPKSTCGNIYQHILQYAAEQPMVAKGAMEHKMNIVSNEDTFLAGIDVQLVSLYPQLKSVQRNMENLNLEKEDDVGEIPLLELISAECLDSDLDSGRPQALSETEKDHLAATISNSWKTQQMS